MKIFIKIVFATLLFFLSIEGFSQKSFTTTTPLLKLGKKENDSKNGLFFGANLGFYFANKYNAQYYNGKGINSVDSVIFHPYNYTNIKQALQHDFLLSELPSNLKYSPALMIGLFFKYSFLKSAFFIQFNFSKLTTKDIFTIQYNDPFNPSIPIYKQESIHGAEQRANIDVGYSYTFSPDKKTRPYIELGVNLNNTKLIENRIKIENLDFSIINPSTSYYKFNEGGIGMGAFIGSGVELVFSDIVSVNPGFNIYYNKTKLGDYYKFKPNYAIFVRVVLNGLL